MSVYHELFTVKRFFTCMKFNPENSLKILLIKRWGNKKFKLLINTVNKNVQDLWGINENTVLQIKVSGQLSRYLEKN